MPSTAFTPWSTLRGFLGTAINWVPAEDAERIAAYQKYDELYWNDPRQFAIRVLEGEDPVYIPNARTVVDTTAHYLLKGLSVSSDDTKTQEVLSNFLTREAFYSRFHTAKHAGCARGDFVLHMTANPQKAAGSRISLNSVDPSMVFPVYHEDIPEKMIACHIVDIYYTEDAKETQRIRKLTYRLEEEGETRRVSREEAVYEMEPKWYGPDAKLVKTLIPKGYLDAEIEHIPIYWFPNIEWEGWLYGSSDLKGFEGLIKAVTQGSTDVQGALSLEGLGVYATDGGRPVDDTGAETDWEVSPGKVMEVPSGSYFRRVEGVGSITPAAEQINYLESKLREGSSLSDVALGRVDVQTAQSGIALAIKFMPTLAKIEERDIAGVEKLKQLFYNWRIWHKVFENETLNGEVKVEIGDKLPQNRTETITELNNMMDRKVISRKYYRDQMVKLGYEFPENIEDEISKDREADRVASIIPTADDSSDTEDPNNEDLPPDRNGLSKPKPQENRSNNRNRTNESNGTEA